MQNILTGVNEACSHKFNKFITTFKFVQYCSYNGLNFARIRWQRQFGMHLRPIKISIVKLSEADAICPDYFRIYLLNIYN